MAGIVKGFRMPVRHRCEGVHGGRRPKSLEGGNREEFARMALSVYGEFAAATASDLSVSERTTVE
jgi:hypothetical protein